MVWSSTNNACEATGLTNRLVVNTVSYDSLILLTEVACFLCPVGLQIDCLNNHEQIETKNLTKTYSETLKNSNLICSSYCTFTSNWYLLEQSLYPFPSHQSKNTRFSQLNILSNFLQRCSEHRKNRTMVEFFTKYRRIKLVNVSSRKFFKNTQQSNVNMCETINIQIIINFAIDFYKKDLKSIIPIDI